MASIGAMSCNMVNKMVTMPRADPPNGEIPMLHAFLIVAALFSTGGDIRPW